MLKSLLIAGALAMTMAAVYAQNVPDRDMQGMSRELHFK